MSSGQNVPTGSGLCGGLEVAFAFIRKRLRTVAFAGRATVSCEDTSGPFPAHGFVGRNGLEKDPPEQDKTPFADGVIAPAAR